MSPETESIVTKVQALLAKAESSEFDAEAEAFRTKAEELMIRHAIDDAWLRTQGNGGRSQDEVVQRTLRFKGIFAGAQRYIANRVGDALGFKVLQQKLHPGEAALWVGFKSELEEAEVLVASLLIQAERELGPLVAEWKYAGYGKQDLYVARRSFLEGFGEQVGRRLKETRRRVEAEATAEVGSSLLPALRSREDQIADAFKARYPKVRQVHSRHSANYGAIRSGRDAGDRADINSKKIGARREISS